MKNGACQLHGGKALKAHEQPRFKTGSHSKYLVSLKGGLRKAYEQAMSGDVSKLTDLTAELVLTEARISELLTRFDADLSAKRLGEIAGALDRADDAARRQDGKAAAEAMRDVKSLLASATRAAAMQMELTMLVEQKRRLSETHTRVLFSSGQALTFTDLLIFVAQFQEIANRYVTDLHQKASLAADIQGLLGPGASPPIDAGR